MKRVLLALILSTFFLTVSAQDFEIVSVESLPADMSAREEIKTDHNDRQCALLRIATQNIVPEQREKFIFTADLGSEVVERVTRDGEVLLWVSPGLKYLIIKHVDWGKYELYLPNYVRSVEALHTYKITVKGTLSLPLQEQGSSAPTQQYLAFRISPANATLFVNDELWEVGTDGTAVRFVNFGTYNYRVIAPNHVAQTGTVTVDDPENTQTVPVTLKPDFVEVTLKVDADAEIWVNNEKKGTRTWTGNLGKGTYKIECKQTGHETSMITKEITADMNGQTIDLPKPTPIYGSLNIESTPSFATIYIDGEMVGETPKHINEILIGKHDIRLTKGGYEDHFESLTVHKGKQSQLNAKLDDDNSFSAISLIDTEIDSKLLEEAYLRKQKDIRASHILIRCDKNALPSDTLKAYNKAMEIRKIALKGADFGDLAVRYSDDPSARDMEATDQAPARKGNRGDLGYFTVFDMVYPFETGAYNTKEGEISMPVRSDFGYHIIKVTSVTDAMGSIQAAHIFLLLPFDAPDDEVAAMKQKADNIYNELMNQDGKNWNEMVKQYTDDKGTVACNGVLRPFTVCRMVPEFVEVCKSLEIGQIAKPVRTYYGFHIIKLLDKTGVGSYEEESQDLRERIEKDMRSKWKN